MNLARDSVTEFKQHSTPFEGISVWSGIWISAPFNSNSRLSLHSSHSLGYYFDFVLGMHTWCTLVGQLDEAEQEIFIKAFQICFDFSSAVCDKSGFLKLVSNLFHDSHNSIKDFYACTEKDEISAPCVAPQTSDAERKARRVIVACAERLSVLVRVLTLP